MIAKFLAGLPEPKRGDMQTLHRLALRALPRCKLWFDDGKNDGGRTVCNPTIGYGTRTQEYSDGRTRDYFQVGLSANGAGISVYILGMEDKTHLARRYGKDIGKAKVTGCCIRFRRLADIRIGTLEAAIRQGASSSAGN